MIDRKQAVEIGITGALIAVGCLSGATVPALVGSIAGIGGNWAADLAANAFDNWSRRWLSDKGALNHDLQRAFGRALADTLGDLKADYSAPDVYKGLRGRDRAAATLALEQLDALQTATERLLDDGAAIEALVTGTPADLRAAVSRWPAGSVAGQQSVPCADQAKIVSLIQQRGVELRRSAVHKARRIERVQDVRLFGRAERAASVVWGAPPAAPVAVVARDSSCCAQPPGWRRPS